MKGFKVFNSDWTCRGFQFEVGKTFTEDVTPVCCEQGFHFCTKASDCFNYYRFNPENKIAEVEAIGEVDTNDKNTKCCTNKLHIIREITWQELLNIVNTGKCCTGLCNCGDYNNGNRNSGDWNDGSYNSGDCNNGNRNSGDWNDGSYNCGDYNNGNWNSGNWNTGSYNCGSWNKTNYSNGCFNTIEPKIHLFNKPSEWTYHDWLNSDARHLLNQIPGNKLKYIRIDDMTDEEKAIHPDAETTGGYLKELDNSECAVIWWRSLDQCKKNVIMAIPNFDKTIFKEITGIDVDSD